FATPFISPDLGIAVTVAKSGYAITLARGTDAATASRDACNTLGMASALVTSYYVTADPLSLVSGTRHYWSGTQATIFFDSANLIAHTEGLSPPPAPAQPLAS